MGRKFQLSPELSTNHHLFGQVPQSCCLHPLTPLVEYRTSFFLSLRALETSAEVNLCRHKPITWTQWIPISPFDVTMDSTADLGIILRPHATPPPLHASLHHLDGLIHALSRSVPWSSSKKTPTWHDETQKVTRTMGSALPCQTHTSWQVRLTRCA